MAPTGKFYLWPGCPAWIKCRFVLLWLKKFNSSTACGIWLSCLFWWRSPKCCRCPTWCTLPALHQWRFNRLRRCEVNTTRLSISDSISVEMKFAEHLAAHITPEWRKQYIQYEVRKQFSFPLLWQRIYINVWGLIWMGWAVKTDMGGLWSIGIQCENRKIFT